MVPPGFIEDKLFDHVHVDRMVLELLMMSGYIPPLIRSRDFTVFDVLDTVFIHH